MVLFRDRIRKKQSTHDFFPAGHDRVREALLLFFLVSSIHPGIGALLLSLHEEEGPADGQMTFKPLRWMADDSSSTLFSKFYLRIKPSTNSFGNG